MTDELTSDVTDGQWVCGWFGAADPETGRRPWQPARRDKALLEILGRCGDGTVSSPWDHDALVELAKHLTDGVPTHLIVEAKVPESPLPVDEQGAQG